jgi:outer membrane protein assembly factor BamB
LTKIKIILTIILLSILFLGLKTDDSEFEIEFIITTFLGNEQRNFYGTNPPDDIEILWKTTIGCGETVIPNVAKDTVKMCGAGWTGQALMIRENNELFLIQGCYDYKLKKINAENGKIIWEYSFNDVI